MISKFALTDKIAMVHGSGRGIGKAIALGFAEAGADIVVVEINPATAETTAKMIRTLGRKALVMVMDITNHAQVKNMVEKTLQEFGIIDILVNGVGGPLDLIAPIIETEEEDWDALITFNLKGAFLCCKEVGKVMIGNGKGSIINISSVAALGPRPDIAPHGAYGAAKAGVINLTQTMAYEAAPYQVRVNCIVPATVETPMSTEYFRKNPGALERRLSTIPLGRLGQPEDIAAAALFLASDASSFITGTSILVSGGIVG